MENEKCLSEEDIENCLNEARARAYEHVLTADPPFSINPEYYILSYTTDQRKKKYLIQKGKAVYCTACNQMVKAEIDARMNRWKE